ncbi:hypothetical protein BUJ14_026170, partial [Salmonella enterica subsp. enterica serovar Rubislaw]
MYKGMGRRGKKKEEREEGKKEEEGERGKKKERKRKGKRRKRDEGRVGEVEKIIWSSWQALFWHFTFV